MEIWKTINIKGFENYQISNCGQIQNKKTGHILKPQKNLYGYMNVLLYKREKFSNVKAFSFRVHRLVLQTFKPVENMDKMEVNHIDCDRSNNNLSNLEWVTKSENCCKKMAKETFYNSKGCYDSNGNFFHSFREAGRFYNISANTVKRDCLGLTTCTKKYKNKKERPFFHF